jgi:type I restriction enzyme S subunit
MKLMKIKDIGTVVSGSTPKTEIKEFWGGNIPWVTPKEINKLSSKYLNHTERTITESGFRSSALSMLPKGSILFTSRAPIGLVAISNIEVCTNQGFKSIALYNDIYPLYIYFVLKKCVKELNDLGTGTTFKELSKSTFENFKIPVPSFTDQIRIGNILDKVESLIKQRKESITLLDEYLKSTFLEMFGDPVNNKKRWNIEKLNKLTQIGTGATPSRTRDSDFYGGDVSWVKTTEVKGEYIYSTEEKITQLALQLSNCKVYPSETVLVAMYGQGKTRGNVGYLKINAATNQACAAILPSKRVNQIFLFKLLKYSYLYLRNLARGGNQENLNLKIVGDIEIILPPIFLQTQFAQIVEKTEALKSKYQQSLQELEQLFGSLSQKAFKGELDLSHILVTENEVKQVIDTELSSSVPTPEKKEIEPPQLEKDGVYSIWQRTREKGNRSKIPFNAMEGNALINTIFALKKEGFSFQEFEAFLEEEGFSYTYEEVKDFLFEKLEKGRLKQHYATQEWMAQNIEMSTKESVQDASSENGRIWLVANTGIE